MDVQLIQVCRPSNSTFELIAMVATLRQEFAELRAANQRLERENLEFRQQAGYWKSRHRDALQRIAELEQRLEKLEGENRQLKADLFGRRTETTTRGDRSNHLDDPPRQFPGTSAETGPATGERRTQATGLLALGGP
jgi:FtsZ-binding cell division protein ZapB